ncbi:MAG: NADH-quinone oxidoreductase subunit NuoF [Chloroflexi bacterium]|nr:NADH-quinone oxidoreductase subunit NuoF [Chloroflexota bacterium]
MGEKIVLRYTDDPEQSDIATYIRKGGYQALARALKELSPEAVVDLVKRSGLRGRGGAGFPTGLKWSFIPKDPALPRYLCCNADEGEPGTFKDREIMEKDPHELIEGIILSSYAIGAHLAVIYIRGEFAYAARQLEKVIRQATAKGYLGRNILGSGYDLDVAVYRGAGAYICGEETALLESLEGYRGQPRLKPPFPATAGLYRKPTVINNVETLANVPYIVLNGPEAFAAIGTSRSPGTKVFCLSGHVKRPGNYELPMGTPLREIIFEHGGGVRDGKQLKAIIPGGPSTPTFTAAHLDVNMDFESVAAAGSMLGSGAVMVMDETACMVWAALRLTEFFRHESCGKCTPCREGTYWMVRLLGRIEAGQGQDGDIELLLDVCDNMVGKCFCPFGDAAIAPVQGTVKHFREEYQGHIRRGGCWRHETTGGRLPTTDQGPRVTPGA